MKTRAANLIGRVSLLSACLGLAGLAVARDVHLRAGAIDRTMPDGQVIPMWGFALEPPDGDGTITVPGPRIEVPHDDPSLTIHLNNTLGVPVSIVIPGQPAAMTPVKFTDSRGRERARSFTHETAPGATGIYTWPQLRPGTYLYHSGSHPAVQVQMGLYGAATRNAGAGTLAYTGVTYDQELLLLFSEIDPGLHRAVADGTYGTPPYTSTMEYAPQYFLVNGEPFVSGTGVLPAGPAGQRLLLRFLNAGIVTHAPVLLNATLKAVAEDGQPYRYPQMYNSLLLPALQTKDVIVTLTRSGGYPLFDRRLYTTNGGASGLGGIASILCTGDPVAIVSQPASVAVCAGGAATFSVVVSGPLTGYQWRKDGVDLPGATADILTIDPVGPADSGQYDVVVSTACGPLISVPATLNAGNPPTIVQTPLAQGVCEGTDATFTVVADGVAPLSYQWRKGGADLPGATSDSLLISGAAVADAGTYDVVVTDACGGTVTSPIAALTVYELPTVVTGPASQVAPEGSLVSFSVTAAGTPPLAYVWRKGGVEIAGATGTTFTITAVTLADAGNYDVVVSNACGSATSDPATLDVGGAGTPPEITVQPQNQSTTEGGTVVFSVTATGTPLLQYQWQKDGVDIPGATSSSLIVSPVSVADVGQYVVVVTNAYGTATSNPATLQLQGWRIWMSFNANTTVPGLGAVQPCDIVAYEPTGGIWELVFDGDDVGLTGQVIDGAAYDAGDLLLSFAKRVRLTGPGTVEREDIIRFTPTTWGSTTAGSFSLYFDGSDVELTAEGENIDAIAISWDGRLLISTTGNFSAGGVTAARQDLLVFNATSLGATTAGTFEFWFDGSDVSLAAGDEDIDAAAITPEMTLLLSTKGGFVVPGLNGSNRDVIEFTASQLGPTTAGTYSLYLPVGIVPAGSNIGSLDFVLWP